MISNYFSKLWSHLLPISSLFVALSSLAVSYLSFNRDKGHLEVYIGLGDILDGTTLQREQSVVSIKVVNVGRRPVTIRGIAGDHAGNWWKKPLNRFFPDHFLPNGYFLAGRDIQALLFNADGTFKVLQEGQMAFANIPIGGHRQQWRDIFKNGVNLYAYDTADRNYCVCKRIFRKFIRDLAKDDAAI